ncbi:Caleosin [Mycena albidolilacea]|uniref:Caleosin n=1 Tax=Mycena albidolilacea TaxID=1033008 RepID=A0AAD7EAC1_9AGAR|nr:Caleosin [Mycena albidolilacea]
MESETAHPALQAHIAFFDTDDDDIIWPTDTYKGFRTIGYSIFFSALSMVVIHSGFSCVRPPMRISIPLSAVHGSDSRAYTQTGTLDESRFNYVFALYSAEPHTHLSFREGVDLVRGNRNPFDVFGWFAAVFEWGATFLLLAEDGRVKREDVHGIMDGTIFPKLAARTKARNEEKARAKAERKNKVKAD